MLTFDHIAIGVGDYRDPFEVLTGALGGLVISGGQPPDSGFRALQVRLGRGLDGMTVEILEPFGVESNDFLARFIAANGDGPHHVTFKTKNIEAELERLRSLGIEPVAIDFSSPSWREMFIHPKDAHGTVVQIAETDKPDPPMDEWLDGLPATMFMYDGVRWWSEPSEPQEPHAVLHRIVIETDDRAGGDVFYSTVLGSTTTSAVTHTDHSWRGGVIRLVDAPVERPAVARLEMTGGPGPKSIGSAHFVPED